MNPLKVKLDEDVFKNDKEYFFTFLAERFEYATILWKEALEKYFGKKFEPIFVIQAEFNSYFPHNNFVIINERLARIRRDVGSKNIIFLSEYEDINQEFSKSKFIQSLTGKMLKKQGRVFMVPFSTTNLSFSSPDILILGPNPKIAEKYDNKIEHRRLFNKLNLPQNKTIIFRNIKEAKKKVKRFPIFLSASFSSGGHESRVIYAPQQIDIFAKEIRKINRSNKFFAAKFIEDVAFSPNSNAIVAGRNQTIVNCVSDQILRAQAYLGNVYPSKATKEQKEIIIKTTKKVGNYLSREGFRGIFGLDFIIDKKGKIYVTDLNPRRQGGYLCHILAARQNQINLIDLELKIFLKKKIPILEYDDFEADFAWAHSKIKPYQFGQKIIKNCCINQPFTPFSKAGEAYRTIFYPRDYIIAGGNIGYYIITGANYNQVLGKLNKDVDYMISDSLISTSWKEYFESPQTYDLIQ